MRNNKENVSALINTKNIAAFLGLAGTATFLPFVFHVQWVTGPIVNAILIIALFLLGRRSAIALCFIPSLMALASGLLPFVLAPFLPFIMFSNVFLVISIDIVNSHIKDEARSYWFAIGTGAAIKYLFLYISFLFISQVVFEKGMLAKAGLLMSWPQFFTAIFGGLIAWFVLKRLKRI
jgi:riboflavin transporter